MSLMNDCDLLRVEDAAWILTRPTGITIYDFPFDAFLACRRPFGRTEKIEVVARVGALPDYEREHAQLLGEGVSLVHTPEEYLRASQLPSWYPLLADLTPRSVWFDGRPDPKIIEAELGWPIFMKGIRQTSRHRRHLSIIDGPDALETALASYARDPVLGWQKIVCRQLVRLRPVEDPDPERIPSSFEFRSFWWRGELAGFGRYWWEGRDYSATPEEEMAALAVAREAAQRLKVTFLVVDVAQTIDGRWIVIECNDGQESGYAGVSPFAMWQRVIEIERTRLGRIVPP